MFLFEITSKKAETDFLFGDCASFAIALQDTIGGDLYALIRNNIPLHIFLKSNGKTIDVMGARNIRSMANSIVGSSDGFSVTGPYSRNNLPCQKPKESKISIAKSYIKANSKKFL